ncbi:MAG: heme o synthase [Planctomycetota bacterium]
MNETLEAVPAPALAAPAVPAARSRVADYLTLAKPGITLMVALTAGVGFWVASGGDLEAGALAHLLGGTLLSAAGAAALNMLLERDLDARMERTRGRPLPAGRIGATEALAFGTLLSVAGIAWLAAAVNPLTAFLSALTIAVYLGAYTPLKTRTSLCTLVGAVPGALPPVMGWTAARGTLEPDAAILFLILFFWQLPHFLALAWMYREDYARAGFRMLTLEGPDGAAAGRQVLLQTLALVVVSLLPAGAGLRGEGYLAAALLLGTGFLGFGAAFAAGRSRERAARLFFASVAYLPLLLGALALL